MAHLLVEARVSRLDGRVGRAPVGHDPPVEARRVLQPPEGLLVLAGVRPVDAVVRAHDGPDARVDGRLEAGRVQLHEGSLRDVLGDAVAVVLLVVAHEVLGLRHPNTVSVTPVVVASERGCRLMRQRVAPAHARAAAVAVDRITPPATHVCGDVLGLDARDLGGEHGRGEHGVLRVEGGGMDGWMGGWGGRWGGSR